MYIFPPDRHSADGVGGKEFGFLRKFCECNIIFNGLAAFRLFSIKTALQSSAADCLNPTAARKQIQEITSRHIQILRHNLTQLGARSGRQQSYPISYSTKNLMNVFLGHTTTQSVRWKVWQKNPQDLHMVQKAHENFKNGHQQKGHLCR